MKLSITGRVAGWSRVVACAAWAMTVWGGWGQGVEKVADLDFVAVDGVGVGGYAPLARFTQVGTDLFISAEVSIHPSPHPSPQPLKAKRWNGVGEREKGRGEPSCVCLLMHSSIWFTTDKGGTFDAGTVSRFDLVTNGLAGLVADLDGPVLGGQAFGGFTPSPDGRAWYFTTFTGGSTFQLATGSYEIELADGTTVSITNNLPIGAGTLGRLTFTEAGEPEDVGRFKTPTLRNIARTAPCMHHGLVDLDGVLNMYNAGMPTVRRKPGQEDDPLFPVKSPCCVRSD